MKLLKTSNNFTKSIGLNCHSRSVVDCWRTSFILSTLSKINKSDHCFKADFGGNKVLLSLLLFSEVKVDAVNRADDDESHKCSVDVCASKIIGLNEIRVLDTVDMK